MIELSSARLKIFSNILSNLSAGWIIALFTTNDPLVLTSTLITAIISAHLAIKTEEVSEKHYG